MEELMNGECPLVSVILPAYNAEKYIRDAIMSIVNQTYKNMEIIVIDDASRDNTVSIVNSIDDDRIKLLVNEKNMRQSATRNKGIMLAKGKYIANMDSDDISLPNRIEKQVIYMEENMDVDVCGTFAKTFGEKSYVVEYPIDSQTLGTRALYATPFAHPTVMFRKSSIKRYEIAYDSHFVYAQDFELFSRLALKKSKFANIPEILFLYRISSEQISYKHFSEQQIFRGEVIERNISCLAGRKINLYTLTMDRYSVKDVRNDIGNIKKLNIDKEVKKQYIFAVLNRASFMGGAILKDCVENFVFDVYKMSVIKLFAKIILKYNPASLKKND